MTRTQRFLGGFASGYAHMIVATLAGLWLTPFFLGQLGQSAFGLWLVGTQIIAYLLLMDLGIVALLPREAAYVTGRTGRRDGPELRALVERTLTLAVAQTPVVLAAALVALFWLPSSWSALRAPLGITLALFVATFPLRVFQAALTGLQDLAFVARAQFAAWSFGTLVNVWLVLRGYGLLALAAGWCLTQVLIITACAVRLAAVFPGAMPRRLSLGERGAAAGYLSRSGWVSVGQLAQALLNGTDVLVIGAALGPAAVVPYACTGKLIAVLANQPQAILQSAAPALSELRMSADRARLFQVSAALAQTTLAVSGLVACVVLALNAGFVSWWVGAEQFGGVWLTLLLIAAMMVRHFNTTSAYTLFCFGKERRLALTALGDGIATLVLSLILVPFAGSAGAPLAAIVGILCVSAPLNLAAVSRETGVARLALLASLGPWLCRFAAVALVAALAGAWVRPASFPSLALLGSSAALLYVMAVLSPLMRSPAAPYLAPLIAPVLRAVGRAPVVGSAAAPVAMLASSGAEGSPLRRPNA